MNKMPIVMSALAALVVLVAACTATSTTSAVVRSSASPASARLGTEVITASTANAVATSVTVKASGVFRDTGTLRLPIGNPRTITFEFTRGNLTVLNATGPAKGPMRLNNATCAFSQSSTGTFRVLSGNSTGSYAGATGHGNYTLDSGGIAAKSGDGSCNAYHEATPPRAVFTFLFQGPLVLNLSR